MINLTKGQNVRIDKGVQKVRVGLSWDASQCSQDADLDVLAIELDNKTDGKCIGDEFVVFYNSARKTSSGKPTDPNEAVIHSGDNRTGDGEGDDETIEVDFSKVDPRVQAILFIVNIYDAANRRQNFGQIKNPRARLYFENTTVPDLVYELDEDFDTQICVEFCLLYRHDGGWKFKAVGDGNGNNLLEELHKYGIPVEGNA